MKMKMKKKHLPIIRSQNAERTPYNIAAIVQLGLIIFDFVMDILFASKKAREVEWLYIPNTIILTISLTINFISALFIINNEKSSNPDFKKWSNAHLKVVSFFALISSADIETLNILQSFDFFKPEFSEDNTKKIFWVACLDILIEDLPQVTIQILYFRTVIYYDIISLLSLASSCLTLTVHIIGRFYQAVNPVVKLRHRLSVSTDDPSKTGGPHPLQFNPEHDISDREIKEIKSLDQEKVGGDGDKGKGRVPEVVVDSQNVGDDEKPNKRSSVGSNFQEMIS